MLMVLKMTGVVLPLLLLNLKTVVVLPLLRMLMVLKMTGVVLPLLRMLMVLKIRLPG
jgi:hypothetical protein